MDTIAMEVYAMLSMRQKKQLEDNYNIDCAYDLGKRIREENEDE